MENELSKEVKEMNLTHWGNVIGKRILILLIVLNFVTIFSVGTKAQSTDLNGPWLGVIIIDTIDQGLSIPFHLVFSQREKGLLVPEIRNGSEVISCREWSRSDSSVMISFPVFPAQILAMVGNDSLTGYYFPKGRAGGNKYRFYALRGVTDRFPWFKEPSAWNVTGRWKITENPGTAGENIMVGEFIQEGDHVTGTVLTTGGDYRFLEGKVSGNRFMMSAVDGSHHIVLKADLTDSVSLANGRFHGGPTWKSTWVAEKCDSVKLPPTDELVRQKTGAPAFGFAFPGMNGDTVSLADPGFKNKVVIVQAAGTWCPNCMDETRFLGDLYREYNSGGLEIIALCFEEKTFAQSVKGIERFRDQTGAGYQFLYAGPRGRGVLNRVFYHLEGPMAFPTTIFIDRHNRIRRVETGFTGPGTGTHYQEYVAETSAFIRDLLDEK